MPEGDTVFRVARTLHRALAGHVVRRFESVYPALTRLADDTPLVGRTIERVEAIGKHVLIWFEGALALRSHLRMNGAWHIYRHGERWQQPARDMRVLVATDDFVAVAFRIHDVDWVRGARGVARHRALGRLGPDLLGPSARERPAEDSRAGTEADGFDEDDAVRRLRGAGALPIGMALLAQRLVAGIGNVYKSEVLFLCGVHPARPAASIDDETLREILRVARRLLRANVAAGSDAAITTYGGLRRTTGRSNPSERLWVYGREGRPCRRCGAPIVMAKHGEDARVTYWCPTCQG